MERRRALLVVAEDEVGRLADVARGNVARDLLVPARVEKGHLRLCSVSTGASTTSSFCSCRPSQTERDAPRCGVLLPSDVHLAALRCRERRLVVDLALRAVAVEDAVRSCSGRSTGQLDARWTGLREREREGDAHLAETVDEKARSAKAEVRSDEGEANMVTRRKRYVRRRGVLRERASRVGGGRRNDGRTADESEEVK